MKNHLGNKCRQIKVVLSDVDGNGRAERPRQAMEATVRTMLISGWRSAGARLLTLRSTANLLVLVQRVVKAIEVDGHTLGPVGAHLEER